MRLANENLGGFSDSITGIFTGLTTNVIDVVKAAAPAVVQYQLARKGIQPAQQQVNTAYGPFTPSSPPGYTQYGQQQQQQAPIQYQKGGQVSYEQGFQPNPGFGVDVGNPQYASQSDNTWMYLAGAGALLVILMMTRGKK